MDHINFETEEITLPFNNLALEVTRRCNLRCKHCMRGEPQDLDMSDEVLDKVINQFSSLYHLSLTGGEPFLAADVIEKMVDKIISNKKIVYRLTSVDNGTILDDGGVRCIKALNKLADYIYNDVWNDDVRDAYKNGEESAPVSISISNSQYHVNDIKAAIDFYSSYANEYVKIDDQGEWETGIKDKKGNVIKAKDLHGEGRWLKKEGRAKDNNLASAAYTTSTYSVEFHADEDNDIYCVRSSIEICANGNVVLFEPLSFETIDNKNMGNILDEPLSALIHKWNWTEPLEHAEVMASCNNMKKLDNPKIPEEVKAKLRLQNTMLDLKKKLFVEGHKDYSYLSHKELTIAAVSKLALIMCDMKDYFKTGDTDEEIIMMVLKNQFTDSENFEKTFTKAELENLINYYAKLNNERLIEDQGAWGMVKYYLSHICRGNDYYENLAVSAYDK